MWRIPHKVRERGDAVLFTWVGNDVVDNTSYKPDNNAPQTQALTLTEYLLRALRHGLRSADKVVRYRSCQLIGNLLNVLEEME